MIFIVGGKSSGKTEYAEKNYRLNGFDVMDDYQLKVRKELELGVDPYKICSEMLSKLAASKAFDKTVIISTEIGGGIVPMDAFERQYRDVNGRVNCLIAQKADKVIRMISGIGQIIKS